MISFVIGLIRSGLQVMIEETVINLYNIHWLTSPQEEEEPGTLQRRSSINIQHYARALDFANNGLHTADAIKSLGLPKSMFISRQL